MKTNHILKPQSYNMVPLCIQNGAIMLQRFITIQCGKWVAAINRIGVHGRQNPNTNILKSIFTKDLTMITNNKDVDAKGMPKWNHYRCQSPSKINAKWQRPIYEHTKKACLLCVKKSRSIVKALEIEGFAHCVRDQKRYEANIENDI